METILSNLTLEEIVAPKEFPGINKLLLTGAQIQPIVRLMTFSPEQFEIFILEWAFYYIKEKYVEVQWRGGSGDKGRDIVAWIDPKNSRNRRWDCYQCKHYQQPIQPSEYWIELAKLCYYTFNNAYTIPENYFIACNSGVGSSLQDLIDDPKKIKDKLIDNWTNYCEAKIVKGIKIVLEGSLLEFVSGFDFSIIHALPQIELIEQHSHTKYHSMIFGTGLKPRPNPILPPTNIAAFETHYVEQIFEAISDRLMIPIGAINEFCDHKDIVNIFNYSRECFYQAESLKEFARDNLPDETYFTDLLEQIFEGIRICLFRTYSNGYDRMLETTNHSTKIAVDSNILKSYIRPADRIGICHHLANEDRVKWVQP